MKIIDIHTHCNCGSRYDVPETELHQRNFPFLMEEYENCGISAGGFSYFSALFSDKESFFTVAGACKSVLFGVVHPIEESRQIPPKITVNACFFVIFLIIVSPFI